MKMIAVECPRCRLIDDVSVACLLLEVGTEAEERGDSCATWICDTCHELVALPVDLTVLVDLAAAGASVLDSAEDARPDSPESAIDGPVFTPDDLLDFHERLQNDDWLAGHLPR